LVHIKYPKLFRIKCQDADGDKIRNCLGSLSGKMRRKAPTSPLANVPAKDLVKRYVAAQSGSARESQASPDQSSADDVRLLRREIEARIRRRDREILTIAVETLQTGADEDIASEQIEMTKGKARAVIEGLRGGPPVAQDGISRPNSTKGPTNQKPDRESIVMPILRKKGWSIYDWANESGVDSHTANGYLKGKTRPYPSTRKKLADALSIPIEKLPV
jgi:lambda repressor-like predicted transcriptional regulator